MVHIRQPDDTALCGQCCVAMAAGVSLDRAIEAVGHQRLRGTYTRELVAGLRALGIHCDNRCKPVSRQVPVLPRRGILAIRKERFPRLFHWILAWDGTIYDPGGKWPCYDGWRITSYLEIHS